MFAVQEPKSRPASGQSVHRGSLLIDLGPREASGDWLAGASCWPELVAGQLEKGKATDGLLSKAWLGARVGRT